MTRDTRRRDFGTAYQTTKRVIKEHTFFHFFSGKPSPRRCRAFLFLLSEKNETIAPCDKNEVVKKASSLTANGDPR